jgi:deoxycytidylate deaminase
MTTSENSSKMSRNNIVKAMKMARHIAENNTACFSRQIGVVITDSDGVVLSTGYNGPPIKSPHPNSPEYTKQFLWPVLTVDEKNTLIEESVKKLTTKEIGKLKSRVIEEGGNEKNILDVVACSLDDCKICPRKIFGYKSGERNDLCSCQHAETNAITFAAKPLNDSILFCWCPDLSCLNCTGTIIQARIGEVHFLAGGFYHPNSIWLYEKAGIEVFRHSISEFD